MTKRVKIQPFLTRVARLERSLGAREEEVKRMGTHMETLRITSAEAARTIGDLRDRVSTG